MAKALGRWGRRAGLPQTELGAGEGDSREAGERSHSRHRCGSFSPRTSSHRIGASVHWTAPRVECRCWKAPKPGTQRKGRWQCALLRLAPLLPRYGFLWALVPVETAHPGPSARLVAQSFAGFPSASGPRCQSRERRQCSVHLKKSSLRSSKGRRDFSSAVHSLQQFNGAPSSPGPGRQSSHFSAGP